jgi:4-amino-4-deoxy-L-arabinose transferase-like glycosyltransferase
LGIVLLPRMRRFLPGSYGPFVLAAFSLLWSLRGVGSENIVNSDAARHALNGVFIHDLLRDGKLFSPVEYGKYYYAHFPSLSLPYHPPLFPLIESAFFALLGVKVFAARLAVAIAVAISAILLYRLVMATHQSHYAAFFCVLTFLSLPHSQWVGSDVMLEFPALVFVLAALYYLRDLDRGYRLGSGLMFSAFAAAAVWTKQHAIFLGLVPFLLILAQRRWHLLAERTIWISSFVLLLLVLPLVGLSMQFGWTGMSQVTRGEPASSFLFRNLWFYLRALRGWFSLVPLALGAIALACFFLLKRRAQLRAPSITLYLVWALAVFLVLLPLRGFDTRYLFLLAPALVVAAYTALTSFSDSIRPVLTVALIVLVGWNLATPKWYLLGPSEAAKAIINGQSTRVLYCGTTNGTFIFSARTLDPELKSVIIRCEKLPQDIFVADKFEEFAHRYGINYIVLERTNLTQWGKGMAWDQLRSTPTASMTLDREIPMTSSEPDLNGDLRIYRFTNPAREPEDFLRLNMPKIGGQLEVRF